MLYQFLVFRVPQSPADLILPFRFYRAAVCKSEVLTLFRELRIDARVQTSSSDDGPSEYVIPYEQHGQISHAGWSSVRRILPRQLAHFLSLRLRTVSVDCAQTDGNRFPNDHDLGCPSHDGRHPRWHTFGLWS